MRHRPTAAALVCVLALSAACGTDETTNQTPAASQTTATEPAVPSESAKPEESETPSEEPEPEPEPEGTVIEMTLADGTVTPAGDRVQAETGEPITFVIDADAGGELHVHSTPESFIDFKAGTSEHEIVVDQPGVVEVELHEPALVVVQLEVR